jgi:predicted transcriptional regulator
MFTNKLEPVILTCWVSPELKSELRELARKADRSMSSVMRRALESYLDAGMVMREADELRLPREMRQ